MPGSVFYHGPSRLDGHTIVAVATWGTENPKTGQLVQTWILRADLPPTEAARAGLDASVCGPCPLRPINGGGCYVRLHHGPRAVWDAWSRGRYLGLLQTDRRPFLGRGLRYGSYGDPVAVPLKAWAPLRKLCTGRHHSGYTHQWANPRFQSWRSTLMASTHTIEESIRAWSLGWKTFRILPRGGLDTKRPEELLCPASPEGGKRATCETCGSCDAQHRNVAIVAHGQDTAKKASRLSIL